MINATLALQKIVKLLKTLKGFCCLGDFFRGVSLVFYFVLFWVIQLQVLEHELCKQELCVPVSKVGHT